MKLQNETRHITRAWMCNNTGHLTVESKRVKEESDKNADITDFVHRAFIIFNYRGQAAKELLEVFKENLKKTGGWHPIDIKIDEALFLSFQVGPMIFFYQNLPCQPETLVMLPARTGILEKSYEWFSKNLNNYISLEAYGEQRKQTVFRIKKKSLSRPGKTVMVNYWG